jgi:hypothetical protein
MSSRDIADGATILGRYGPGGNSGRPELNRWVYLYNNSGYTMFIPEATAAERESVYNYFPYKYTGGYGYSNNLYVNPTAHATGPCWSPYFAGSYNTPGACSSGYTDGGVVNGTGNAIDYNGATGVQHGTIPWMFYFVNAYGCPSGFVAGYSIRYCYRTAGSTGYV